MISTSSLISSSANQASAVSWLHGYSRMHKVGGLSVPLTLFNSRPSKQLHLSVTLCSEQVLSVAGTKPYYSYLLFSPRLRITVYSWAADGWTRFAPGGVWVLRELVLLPNLHYHSIFLLPLLRTRTLYSSIKYSCASNNYYLLLPDTLHYVSLLFQSQITYYCPAYYIPTTT